MVDPIRVPAAHRELAPWLSFGCYNRPSFRSVNNRAMGSPAANGATIEALPRPRLNQVPHDMVRLVDAKTESFSELHHGNPALAGGHPCPSVCDEASHLFDLFGNEGRVAYDYYT